VLPLKRIGVGIGAFLLGAVVAVTPWGLQIDDLTNRAKSTAEQNLAGAPAPVVTETITTTVNPVSTVTETTSDVQPASSEAAPSEPAPSKPAPSKPKPSDGGGGTPYYESDAALAMKACTERYPGFSETDLRNACVQAYLGH
jgi:hypothetical protein